MPTADAPETAPAVLPRWRRIFRPILRCPVCGKRLILRALDIGRVQVNMRAPDGTITAGTPVEVRPAKVHRGCAAYYGRCQVAEQTAREAIELIKKRAAVNALMPKREIAIPGPGFRRGR